MKIKNFFVILKNSALDLIKNPILFILGAFLWLVLFLISKLSGIVSKNLSNSFALSILVAVFFLIFLIVLSAFFCIMVFFAVKNIEKNKKKNFFITKIWLRNIVILLIISLISMAIGRIADFGARHIVNFLFGFNLFAAQIIFIVIYLALLVGVFIFFTYAGFFLVIYEAKIIESIKKSFNLVKREYFSTLTISLLAFFALFLVSRISNQIFSEFFEYVIILPFILQTLTRFVLENSKNDIRT